MVPGPLTLLLLQHNSCVNIDVVLSRSGRLGRIDRECVLGATLTDAEALDLIHHLELDS